MVCRRSLTGVDPASRRRATPFDPATARVCIVMPVRNEASHIRRTLDSVLAQSFPADRLEIVAVDGVSTDGTDAILHDYERAVPLVRVLTNPLGTAPTSLNVGIRATTAEIIARVDGHCELAPDYIERCVDLLASSGAGNVGGPMHPIGRGTVGRTIAAAMSSPFGVGNARFHYSTRAEVVDTVYLGCFRREVLNEVGLYDESLTRNQDDELNYRIRSALFDILLSPDIVSSYTPRDSLRALWRQFYQFGLWKVRVMQKHPGSIQPRHLAPPAFVLGLCLSVTAACAFRRVRFLALPALYEALVVTASARAGRRSPAVMAAGLAVFPCLHISYGVGVVVGCLRAALGVYRRDSS